MARFSRSQPPPPKQWRGDQTKVSGAVATVASAQTVQVQVISQAEQRARRRAPTAAKFITNPRPPFALTTAAGITTIVTAQAVARGRRQRPTTAKFITAPQVGAAGAAPTTPQATPVVPALLQSVNRSLRSRLGRTQPFPPKLIVAPQIGATTVVVPSALSAGTVQVVLQATQRALRRARQTQAKFVVSPQTAPFPGQAAGVIGVVSQAIARRAFRPKTATQFIVTNPALTPPTVTTGQPAGVYVRVVSEAVTRETQQRLGRGVPFPAKFIVPPQVGAAPPPPATVTTAGEGFNPTQRRRYVVRGAIEPEMIALLLEQGIITEEEAALMLAMS